MIKDIFLTRKILNSICPLPDKKSLELILVSSALLGIWATAETIALRNFLLAIGVLIAILYWKQWIKSYQEERKDGSGLGFFDYIPLLLICLMFIWVITHYLFLSQFPEKQWNELSSTWLRSLLATIIGSATGLALHVSKKNFWLLWLGLVVSFLILIGQYIPKALVRQSLFAIDFYGNYIYQAKFNGVLAGIILFAGLFGMLIDRIRYSIAKLGDNQEILEINKKIKKHNIAYFYYTILGFLITIFSFVFIFDAKNGVGIICILIAFWSITSLIYLLKNIYFRSECGYPYLVWKKCFFISLIFIAVFLVFGVFHVKNNPGWGSLLEDIAISLASTKDMRWQNPSHMGFPKRSDGQSVAGNVYERTSWGVVGFELVQKNPIGIGIFRALPQQMKLNNIHFDSAVYTHSGWIDLGIAFGLPGLLLIPMAIIIIWIRAIAKPNLCNRALIITMAISILIIYLVGEQAFQHGIEILFFMVAFLATLSWKK